MTYKLEDWQRVVRRLQLARQAYLEYKRKDAKSRFPDELDEAILKCWSFGEYAVNVCLEWNGEPVPQDHSQPAKAKDLFALGKLGQDYSEALEKLERFRKKASHLSYNKESSTHYSSADVDRCLTQMEALCAEVVDLIQKPRRRP